MLTARRLFRVSSFASLAGLACMFEPPSFRDCHVSCNDGEACPSGMECRAEPSGNAFCIAPDFPGSCEGPPASLVDACGRSGALVIEPCTLPPPCAGTDYEFSLQLGSGDPRQQQPLAHAPVWRLAPESGAQMQIDASTGRLSGNLTEAITLDVSVSDGTSEGRAFYRLEPRSSCWFAHPGPEEDGRRVTLIDPLLLEAAPRVILPEELPAGARVEDFRFSPDGRWLAVRIDEGGPRRIELFAAPRWTSAGAVDAAGSVVEYAWAPDGRVLAIVAETGAERTLGGVRVSGDPAVSAGAVVPLTPVPTPADPPLVWVGSESIAFHAQGAEDPARHYLHSGRLVDGAARFSALGAFDAVAYRISETLSLTLVPSRAIFVAIQSDGTTPSFRSFSATNELGPSRVATFLPGEALVSPTGEYLARSLDGQLELYRTDEPTDEPSPSAAAPGCDRVLGWSSDDSRLVCSAASDLRGALRVFSLANGQLTGAVVEGDYDYPLGRNYRRRAFAPGGRWLAFTTDLALYSIELGREPPQQRSAGTRVDSVNAATELAFSPDGEALLVHSGQWLTLSRLAEIDSAESVTDALLDEAQSCREADAWASSDACGTARTRSSQIVWSPDSQVFVFRTATNELRLHQTRAGSTPRLLSNSCDGRCIASSDFQPIRF